jgi:TfoX/Sxy family transcriptional regulator of competence genes
MATQQETVNAILARAGDALELEARKMFGEYGIYLEGRIVALICDETLFVKDLPTAREHLGTVQARPPYPHAKPHLVVPVSFQEEDGRLEELFRALAKVLPPPRLRCDPDGTPRKPGRKRL